ncbi:hypothetical protein BCF55_1116 [Hydrogenivirga caldilitoris]|uniref:Uncharacterized protein n=1 Tax=Hydrogenivirga caldilitoris TaxID=246264 RepID=A0A497XUK3_9AQUI|nr:hypothetical protein BCF55_1116 [Hydrogenivirga caldilitoris]
MLLGLRTETMVVKEPKERRKPVNMMTSLLLKPTSMTSHKPVVKETK